MRYLWTDAGNDPDFNRGDLHGINGFFQPMFDYRTTLNSLAEIRNRGHAVGIYYGHNWLPGADAKELANQVNDEYLRLQIPDLKVQFNLEQHSRTFVSRVFEEWRRLQLYVDTSWTMEGMQGGWMTPEFVSRILNARVRLVPQCFTGDMTRRESDVVLRDLTLRGFPESLVSPFYDAAQLGLGWSGFAFTAGRLPRG